MINLQTPPALPSPAGLAGAFGVLGTPDIFRDLSRGAELLQFINNATKEAFTSTRQHRAAMDAIAGEIVKMVAGGTLGGGAGALLGGASGPTPGAASSGTTGITPTSSGGGAGAAAGVVQSAQTMAEQAAAQQVRSTKPTQVSDLLQTVSKAQQNNQITPEQANQISNALLGGASSAVGALATLYGAGVIPPGAGSTKAEALAAIGTFASGTSTSPWKLSRASVANRLAEIVNDPNVVDQDSLNLCGPASFVRLWVARDPLALVNFAARLYNHGMADIGAYHVEPGSDSLIAQDYAALSAAAGPDFIPSADWMVLGAIRDSENFFFDFEGVPGETVAAGTTPGEIAEWLMATGLYSNVSNEGNFFLTKGLSHALSLNPSANRDVAMLINAHILDQMNVTSGPKKASDFILSAFPNHFIVLASPVIELPGDRIQFSYWTWGQPVATGDVDKAVFEANYYGAVIAER
jgi:hypothetical protein